MKTDGLKIIILSVFLTFSCINVMGQKYNNIDKQGRRQGKWIEYFDNGKVRFEGQFKDDFLSVSLSIMMSPVPLR